MSPPFRNSELNVFIISVPASSDSRCNGGKIFRKILFLVYLLGSVEAAYMANRVDKKGKVTEEDQGEKNTRGLSTVHRFLKQSRMKQCYLNGSMV